MTNLYYLARLAKFTHNPEQDFTHAYPDHVGWLHDQNLAYTVTNYVWPDMLTSMMHIPIDMRMSEFMLTMEDHDADAFIAFCRTSTIQPRRENVP